jgi:hypothetical protein
MPRRERLRESRKKLAEAEPGRAQFSVSADGRRIARFLQKGISTRDLASGREETLDAPKGLWRPVLSPDGARVAWSAEGHLFAAPPGGGESRRIGWGSPVEWWRDRIVTQSRFNALTLFYPDNPKVRPREFMRTPSGIYQARYSPDGRWMAIHTRPPRGRRVWIVPIRDGEAAAESAWIPVTEERTESRDPAWSGDGATLFYLSERDGFRCIWAQPLDRETKKPRGQAFAVRHFHRARLGLVNVRDLAEAGLSWAGGKLFFVLYESTGEIWKTRLPG